MKWIVFAILVSLAAGGVTALILAYIPIWREAKKKQGR